MAMRSVRFSRSECDVQTRSTSGLPQLTAFETETTFAGEYFRSG